MPELPTVKALAERLADIFVGLTVSDFHPLQFSALKTFDPDPASLAGRTLTGTGVRGKYLILEFDGPRVLIHLSQAGRVTVEEPAKTTKPKNGVVRFRFGAGNPGLLVIEYGTERKAGWWVLAEGDDGPLSELGPEWGTEGFAAYFREVDDNRRLHTILRDQRTVSGIGRGYSDDILHRAQLSPYQQLAPLDADQREALLVAIDEILEGGLEAERQREGGLPPKLGDHWVVHARHGEPCPRCGEELKRVWYEAYEVTYCPACQTDGKVLADRRMSRVLR